MPVPILTDSLIDRVMREQRQQLRPLSGWGNSVQPLQADQALAAFTSEGSFRLGWTERANHGRTTNPVRRHLCPAMHQQAVDATDAILEAS